MNVASIANAQFGPPSGGYGGGGGSDSPFSSNGGFGDGFFGNRSKMVTAHAVLATVAFGLLFPVGGILIRLASFRGLWLAHGLFQIFAYVLFAIAFGLGIYMYKSMPDELPNGVEISHEAHPIIGIVAFCLLFLQPWLGLLHHFAFKKHSKRVFWSYAHLWIGRFVIALGIVNGGLGLQLSQKIGQYAPHKATIIAYSVAAGVIYLLYVLAAIYGEAKRKRARYDAVGNAPPPYKRERHGSGYDSRDNVQFA